MRTAEYWLGEWARWMRQSSTGAHLGYPGASPGLASGGASEQFDALVERADHRCVIATDAAIRSLGPAEQAAVQHVHLGAA